MKLKTLKQCPLCHHRLSLLESRQFSKGLKRRLATCPQCGAWLVWAATPWRLLNGSVLTVVVALVAAVLVGEPAVFVLLGLAAVCLIAFFVAAVRQRLVPFEPDMTVKGGE